MDHLIIGMGTDIDPQRIQTQTRRRWNIPNCVKPDRAPASMKDAYDRLSKYHPSLRIRSQRSHYSCVGLVFGSRRTFIDIEHVRRILEEDGYRPVDLEKSERGDVVLYEDIDGIAAHVGLLWNYDPQYKVRTVLSQWGTDGEYFHNIDDVVTGWKHRITLWTERLILG